MAFIVHPGHLKPRGQTGLLQLIVPSKHFSSLFKIRRRNTRSNDTTHISNTVVTRFVLWQGRNNTLWSTQYLGSQDSSVSTVTTVWSRGLRHCGTVPGWSKCSVLQSTKISHQAHAASYRMSIQGSFSRGKQSGCEHIHPPPSSN